MSYESIADAEYLMKGIIRSLSDKLQQILKRKEEEGKNYDEPTIEDLVKLLTDDHFLWNNFLFKAKSNEISTNAGIEQYLYTYLQENDEFLKNVYSMKNGENDKCNKVETARKRSSLNACTSTFSNRSNALTRCNVIQRCVSLSAVISLASKECSEGDQNKNESISPQINLQERKLTTFEDELESTNRLCKRHQEGYSISKSFDFDLVASNTSGKDSKSFSSFHSSRMERRKENGMKSGDYLSSSWSSLFSSKKPKSTERRYSLHNSGHYFEKILNNLEDEL